MAKPVNPRQNAPHLSNHPLVRAVARALRRHCGVGRPQRILVAVSGGADSVALLRALAWLATRRNWPLELAAGHVHHHLRGQAADDDAAFVETLAEQLDLPYLRADLDLPTISNQGNLEARARRERYRALAAMAATLEARYVATAHHSDDQLETLLMRLVRGSGVAGLRGIARQRALNDGTVADGPPLRLIRPMLDATHAQAVDLLHQLGQPWREDHTNADVSRLRAKLRHDVLPTLRQIAPHAARRAVVLGHHFQELHRLVDAEVDRHHEHAAPEADGQVTLDRGEARLMPKVVLTALLRRLLHEAGVGDDRLTDHVLRPIIKAIHDQHGGERRFDLAGGVHVMMTRTELRVSHR